MSPKGNFLVLCLFYFLFFLFCRLQNEKWMNVRVGDIIKLENNQFVAVSVSVFRKCAQKKEKKIQWI